ncbi:hypothetical protein I4U23_025140 [Adineta vaga]|nr:hypothetical protein I4U23_025140 [Adineta vaga]
MADHHHHHHHHHDYAKANADHFSEKSQTYTTELSTELAKRCAASVLKNYPFDSNQTEVLDFACGPGLVSFQLLPHAKRIEGADLAPGMVDVFNKQVEQQGVSPDKLHCTKVDLLKEESSDLGDALFDVIVCTQSYHHFEDTIQVTRALSKRLKPKGRLIIIDFIHDECLEKFFGRHHDDKHPNTVAHKHGFTFDEIINMFKATDLQNPQVASAFQMSKSEIKSYQGHEIFEKVLQDENDFTLKYFIAYADKA